MHKHILSANHDDTFFVNCGSVWNLIMFILFVKHSTVCINSSFYCPDEYRLTVDGTFCRYASLQDRNTSSNFQEKLQAIKHTHETLGCAKTYPFLVFYSKAQWKQLFIFCACNLYFSKPEQQPLSPDCGCGAHTLLFCFLLLRHSCGNVKKHFKERFFWWNQ